jgi:predicted ATP-grasp superfamily ATP-dependent carboligase
VFAPTAFRPPILLSNAFWAGTLAAVRILGRHGIPVILADQDRLPPARFSRHLARYVRSPPPGESFVEWLLDFGRREPGYVLYPTSDSLTYLYALHSEVLGRHFRLSLAPLDGIVSVLDKKRLYTLANAVGLSTPKTWFPETREDLLDLERRRTGALVVKPRTQILSRTQFKGSIVTPGMSLAREYEEYARENTFGRALVDHYPDMARPMVQEYHPEASERIYLVAGFVDEKGELCAARASMKVLQWPRRLGLGVCFEHAPLDRRLLDGLRELCRAAGYHGLFQVEFIRTEDRDLLIDFNPRFYAPLAFEIARGLPLPLMVYTSACGYDTWLRSLVATAEQAHETPIDALCNGFSFHVMVNTQRLSGRLSLEDARRWQKWYADREGRRVDSVADRHDPLPFVVYAAGELYRYVRHGKSFVRSIVLDR